jgi:hypothetical protein
VKADEIDVLARSMLGDLEEINYAQEPGFNGQLMSDVLNRDLLNRVDLDFTLFHPVAAPDPDVRALPDTNARGDRPTPYTLSKSLRENHITLAANRAEIHSPSV